ncbi:MAG: potassium transporter Trk [Candidatus Cloacimonadota bacterium]|nr:MAG: potassium transporter Trk [Candidatus Cloacimonadota bacterium]
MLKIWHAVKQFCRRYRFVFRFIINATALVNSLFLIVSYLYPDIHDIKTYYLQASLGVFALHILFEITGAENSAKNLRAALLDTFALLVGFFFKETLEFFQLFIIGRQLFFFFGSKAKSKEKKISHSWFYDSPSVIVLLSFLGTIAAGTFLLMLPEATTEGVRFPFADALFTSTSATCVTGLAVVDTGTYFSRFGQIVILLLIQTGGLGIMTVSTAFAMLLGQNMTMKSQSLMQNVVGESSLPNMFDLIKNIVYVTLFFEGLGAAFLYLTFRTVEHPPSDIIYHSVFHSVSAFCNAGFSLNSDSFSSMYSNIPLNYTIMMLIITGGIGFSVMTDIRKNILQKFQPQRFSLHTKLVLVTTTLLIFFGAGFYFVAEYSGTMSGFAFTDRITASMFQSVSTRTAGFNTIDNGQLSQASVLLTLFLMFAGASPGSTGGGIKTTTLAIICLSVWAILQGDDDVTVFRRKISDRSLKKVLSLIAVSAVVLFFLIFILFLTEKSLSFETVVFEAVSAFATVGLSMGITSKLSVAGKIIITVLMYLGRVGPLTLIFALSEKKLKKSFAYTEENISIG